jgi:fatty acid amide hydrolase 2
MSESAVLPGRRSDSRLKDLDLEKSPAVDLAAAVRARRVSPSELVDEFIARIQARNPRLNAVVADRFDDARADARRMTALVGHGDNDALPPFFGVPCTIKECFGVKGMPHTAGSTRRKKTVAGADGAAVTKMRDAGFIPLGVTNVPEMAFWYETENLVFGRTNNPYDVTRTVGGSSGGEGAIVGAGASPVGLGSDTGGSIRMPATFCGLFGHKPTGGIVAGTGHVPAPSPSLARFTCYGPLARSAEDLLPVLRCLAGDDGVDPGVIDTPDLRTMVIEGPELTVHVIDESGWVKPNDAVRSALWSAAAALEARGARIHHVKPPELKRAFDMWAEAMQQGSHEGRSFVDWLGDGDKLSVAMEVLALVAGRPRHTKEALLFAALEKAGKRLRLARGGLEVRERLRDRLRQLLLNDRHVILSPAFPVQAFPHGTGGRYPAAFVYAGLWNVLEMPATAVPLGLDGDGLPLGCQVIGRRGADRVTIGVAALLERLFGGRVPPHARTSGGSAVGQL